MEEKNKSESQKEEQQKSSFWLEFLGENWFYILLALLFLFAKIFNIENVPICELFGCDRRPFTRL